ncbi:hypothetical protein HK101_001806, partial [Irineochytrium annulatum]
MAPKPKDEDGAPLIARDHAIPPSDSKDPNASTVVSISAPLLSDGTAAGGKDAASFKPAGSAAAGGAPLKPKASSPPPVGGPMGFLLYAFPDAVSARMLNVMTVLSFIVVSFAILLHILDGELVNLSDNVACQPALAVGSWRGPKGTAATKKPAQWTPDRCFMAKYQQQQVQKCLGDSRVLFVGDSTVRSLYFTLSRKLVRGMEEVKAHSDLTTDVPDSGTRLEFYWDPFLN